MDGKTTFAPVGQKRWKALATYRSSISGIVDVEHEIEELSELEPLIERGQDWNTIDKIVVVLARVEWPEDTIESAERR